LKLKLLEHRWHPKPVSSELLKKSGAKSPGAEHRVPFRGAVSVAARMSTVDMLASQPLNSATLFAAMCATQHR